MLTDFVHTAHLSLAALAHLRALCRRVPLHPRHQRRSSAQFPRALREQIVMYVHRQTLEACDLFELLTTGAQRPSCCVTPTVCLQKEVLVGRGELCGVVHPQRGAAGARSGRVRL